MWKITFPRALSPLLASVGRLGGRAAEMGHRPRGRFAFRESVPPVVPHSSRVLVLIPAPIIHICDEENLQFFLLLI